MRGRVGPAPGAEARPPLDHGIVTFSLGYYSLTRTTQASTPRSARLALPADRQNLPMAGAEDPLFGSN